MIRKSSKVILILLLNVVVIGIVLEGAARLLNPYGDEFSLEFLKARYFEAHLEDIPTPRRGPETPATEFFFQMALHPYLGYTHHVERRPDFEMGFPGGPKLFAASSDRVVIAVSGGSLANLLCTSSGGELEVELRQLDAFRGKSVEILCLALSGYKQPQQLMTLNYFLALGGHFDVWINLDGFNEIVLGPLENEPQGIALVFPRKWNLYSRKALEPLAFSKLVEISAARTRQKQLAARFAFPLTSRSAFLLTLWFALDNQIKAEIVALHGELDTINAREETSAEVAGPARSYAALSDMIEAAAEIWKNSSRQMAYVSAGYGIHYVHLLQPNQYLPGSKTLTPHELAVAYTEGEDRSKDLVQAGYPVLIRAGDDLRAEGIAFFDLTRIFHDESRSVYQDACCHVNDLGNRLLAEAVASAVAETLGPVPAP